MSDQMVILIVKSKDNGLKESFERFKECASLSTSKEISFQERVDILERMGEWAEKVQERIAFLSSDGVPVGRADDSLVRRVSDASLRSRLSNGLFSKAEMNEVMVRSGNIVPDELAAICNQLMSELDHEEYILFWNIGELEANDLLSY